MAELAYATHLRCVARKRLWVQLPPPAPDWKLMSIFYTRKGDNGKSYVGKKVLDKTCLEIEALGQLDELNSIIGVLKSGKISKELKETLHQIQENLFTVQANVASVMLGGNFKVPKLEINRVVEIENIINKIEKKLKPVRGFVVSGTNNTSAWLDFLRAKSRNVERSVLKINKTKDLDPDIKTYLNRLSSLFFALARWEVRNTKEPNPRYK